MDVLTPRLRLRCLRPTDAADLVAHMNDWQVARWLARPPYPYSAEDADEFILFAIACHAERHPLLFAIADARTDRLLGVAGIERGTGEGVGELGYWLGRPFWGRGYGQEMAAAMVERARAAGLGLLLAFVHPDNRRSLALLECCGFERAGTALREGRGGELLMRRFALQLAGAPASAASIAPNA